MFCASCGKNVGRTTSSSKRATPPRLRCVNMRSCHNHSAYFDTVEKEIMAALREWLKGYKVKIDTVGYDDDIQNAQEQLNRLEHEQQKLTNQMDNIFDLLEQGVHTLDVFQSRRGKLTLAMEEAEAKSAEIRALIAKMESSQETRSSLIPQTEELPASYDEMTNGERNRLLKEILEKIEYYKSDSGEIVLDLYPRLPRL